MRWMIFAPLAFLPLGAMAPPQAPDAARKCPVPVVTAATPRPDKPMIRKLGKEPPAALIATVHSEVDGCPVMLVLDGGQTGAGRGWTPALEGGLHHAK